MGAYIPEKAGGKQESSAKSAYNSRNCLRLTLVHGTSRLNEETSQPGKSSI